MTKPIECPQSDIKSNTGWVGVVTLTLAFIYCYHQELELVQSLFLCLLCSLIPMVLCDVFINKTYLNSEFDYSKKRMNSETFPIVKTKFVGFLAIVAFTILVYSSFDYYATKHFAAYLHILASLLPVILIIAPIYFWVTTKYMREPKDALWQFGKLVTLQTHHVERAKMENFCKSWAIKIFFFAFMASFVAPQILYFTDNFSFADSTATVTDFILLLLRYILIFDMALGTVGYIMTFKILNSHIRSANPFLAGWVAALICYPPFSIIGKDNLIHYQNDTLQWYEWLAGNDTAIMVWGALIVFFTATYTWATIVFGIRFSNLTHRGIITNGPFKYTKHPAYLSKNIFWWLTFLPFLTTSDTLTAFKNCMMLLLVNLIYFWRAKTEEQHLMEDSKYRDYVAWMNENGLIAKFKKKFS